jgi:uncharacterized protein (DUF952 family)
VTAILHITTAAEWDAAQAQGEYQPATFAEEGFVHCSTLAQVAGVATAYYADVPDLVVLVIDEARITAPVRYERSDRDGNAYPHIYGPIDPAWVVAVQPLDADAAAARAASPSQ